MYNETPLYNWFMLIKCKNGEEKQKSHLTFIYVFTYLCIYLYIYFSARDWT
jgi:hypothetical protein